MNPIDIDWGVRHVVSGHLVEVRLELPETFAGDLVPPFSLISTYGVVGNVTVSSLTKAMWELVQINLPNLWEGTLFMGKQLAGSCRHRRRRCHQNQKTWTSWRNSWLHKVG